MSHGDTSAMNQKDHLACERARVKAASSGRNVHGSMESHISGYGGSKGRQAGDTGRQIGSGMKTK